MPFTKMKSSFSFVFILSLLLLVSGVSYARKDLEDYWQKKMKGLPMPELIRDLVLQNQPSEKDLFVRDFDFKPNVIIYHSHVASKDQKKKEKKKKNQRLVTKKIEAENNLFRKEDNLAQ